MQILQTTNNCKHVLTIREINHYLQRVLQQETQEHLAIHLVNNDLFPEWLIHVYNYSWFVGFALAALAYRVLMNKTKTN